MGSSSFRTTGIVIAFVSLVALATKPANAITLSFVPLGFETPGLPAPGADGFNVGDTTLVEVAISGISDPSGLISFQLALQYDTSQIEIFDPNSGFNQFLPLGGSPLCDAIRGEPCADSEAFITSTGRTAVASPVVIDAATGLITFGYGTIGSQDGPTGDGALAILAIRRIGTGGSEVSFQTGENPMTRILLGSGEAAFDTQNLNISEIPIPAAGVLLASALGLTGAVRAGLWNGGGGLQPIPAPPRPVPVSGSAGLLLSALAAFGVVRSRRN